MAEGPTQSADRAQHWDAAYEAQGFTGVSWFQATTSTSIELIEAMEIGLDDGIIDVGGSASLLADSLVTRGFRDLTVLDVSRAALEATRQRLGPSAPVSLLREDLLAWRPVRQFELWHDRAVFHFLTNESDRDSYVDTLRSALNRGGAVIMATFAADGPEYCSGLPVARYSPRDFAGVLGNDFDIVEERREVHHTPVGAIQPFTWVAARLSDKAGPTTRVR